MRTRPARSIVYVACITLAGLGAVGVGAQTSRPLSSKAVPIAELWVKPQTERDLFFGPGGRELAPDPNERYKVIEIKVGGFSGGYSVKDSKGREWSAKFPPEASTEVAASRIHWGIGYHQPPIYFVREWNAEGADDPNPQLPARFREKDPRFHGLSDEGDWSFYDNPFVGTRELAGLLVLQVMLGNSDLKDSNNTLYTLEEPMHGVRRWYVTRDIGHTFGRAGLLGAPRGDVEAFEQSRFIRQVIGNRVVLDFRGRHRELVERVTTEDVRWVCEQLDHLTDRQWEDAFRAAGYERGTALRFITRLKSKIAEGLSLPRVTSQGGSHDLPDQS